MSSNGHSFSSLSHEKFQHQCITTLKIPNPHISCLAARNNLLYVASINEISVFDLSNYTLIDTYSNDLSAGSVKSIAFSSTKVFTAHQDCKIRVWQMTPSKKHQLVSTLPTVKDRFLHFMLPKNYTTVRRHKKRLWLEHWDTVSDLVVKEGLMYSVSWDKSFKIWNPTTYRCLESVKAHEDAVNAVAVSDVGVVYTASADGLIRAWEKVDKDGKHTLIATLERHKSTVNALALKGDGSLLFSGGCDHSIVVWGRENNGDQMVFVEALRGHTGAILCLINVDDLIVSGSADRTVRVWQCGENGYRCITILKGHEKPVKSLVNIKRGGCNGVVSICSGSLDGEIKVWEVRKKKLNKKSLSNVFVIKNS
ncbi:protein JINGUBANG-like [Pistacia vera]|uniref:protein JINGUBANG-like n=1 Tax=Pistacia vera TaxID=55513 RepID=UPI00126397CA|nr:protein JINGUBANG-like [Pistacia vera]